MVWYLSITTHNMVVIEYEYADLFQSLDKCSHNFILCVKTLLLSSKSLVCYGCTGHENSLCRPMEYEQKI